MSTLHVLFRVGQTEYVLPATDVLHMDAYEGATAVPGTPEWVAGLVQVRGRVVPVVELRRRFGLPHEAPTLQSRVIVVQDEDRVVALVADSSREVLHIPHDAFKKPPEGLQEDAHGFVKAVAQAGKRLVMLVDVHQVVGTDALANVNEDAAVPGRAEG